MKKWLELTIHLLIIAGFFALIYFAFKGASPL